MVLIRPAVAHDAPAISALILGESHHVTLAPDGRGADAILDSMREPAIATNLASPRFAYWVGAEGESLQGVISLRDGRHLYHMFVPTRLHRQGVGRQLWQYLLATLNPEHSTQGITVNASDCGVPAYQRLGFVATGPRTETKGVAFVPMVFLFPPPHQQES